MTATLTRRNNTTPTHTEWSVHGPNGAVSFAVHHQSNGEDFYGAIGLHHDPAHTTGESGLPLAECHLIDGGTCRGDSTWRYGRDLGERWNATGRRDETIYAELDEWYASRFA